LTYKKSFRNHNFDLLLGHESLDRKASGISGQKTDFILPNSPWLDHAGKIQDLSNGGSEYGIEGYLSRLNYDYAGKYFLNASVRRDGSSRFAPENRWGTFYGFGASWIVSKESWFSNFSWLNTFKLKASYGQQGNDNLGVNLPYLDQYGVILSTDSTPVGLVQSSLGNRNITWEKNSNINAGFDLNLFNDRLDIQAEYFNRSVSDMLFFRPLQPSSGFNVLPENSGDMKNEGAELTVRGDIVRTNNFGFTLSANATYVNNEITKLPQERILTGTFIRTKGSSAYTYYLREFVGVNPLNGRSQFYKDELVGGVATGNKVITENYAEATFYQQDKTALAKVYGGFDTALRYKNIDLGVAFAYQFGGYGYDSNYMNFFSPDAGQNLHRDIANTWTPENTTASLPMVDLTDTKLNYATSTLGLIKSDYISIQNISAGYTFPSEISNRFKLSSLRFYGLVDNVALWSKRQGYDPRLSLVGGSDNKYSLFRTISFGINVKF
jgi:TonB-linked SusC/RagA family outer membrane protein